MDLDPREVEAELISHYDLEADDRARRPLGPERLEARRRFVAELDPTGPPLLEVGTGPGRDIPGLAASGLQVVGVDLSFQQSRHARAAGAHQVVASVRQLPFRARSFGAVWTMSTLMHVPSGAITGALDEIRRVVVPDGMVAIGVWGGPDVEEHFESGRLTARLFSRRSDDTWQRLLSRIGEIQNYETWGWDEEEKDLWYQWALLRTT